MPILKPEVDLSPSHLFELPRTEHPWWVAWVRSRQEKGLARHLAGHGVGFYLPQAKKQTLRVGRSFVSSLPLFPGYLFFRGPAAARLEALQSNLLVQVLPVLDQEELQRELVSLWRLQQSGAPLVPLPYLEVGDEVEVKDGPFRGWTGKVLREKGKLRLVVSITLLRQSVAAELDREVLAPLRHRQMPPPARAPRPSRTMAAR
ncbi:MAG TPA: transcription termination/antitermination NusG family protein [Thermoanaerobaculia bacterium]|nr:transcription termination/antitermination NusG family protein [Thermoanaerobaculia bacterium]